MSSRSGATTPVRLTRDPPGAAVIAREPPDRVGRGARSGGPYGDVPEPVARVCELTFYCSRKDVHPTPAGHALIADEILRLVPLTSQ